MRSPIAVAAAQPACTALDVRANALVHARLVRAAQARVVVFPELSLTGYELAAEPISADDPALTPLIVACAESGSLALAGAPVEDDTGHIFIAMLRIEGTGVRIAYRKSWLGGSESIRFTPGDGPTVLHVDDWRFGLGICKDTGAAQHTTGTAALGVDAYLAGLVHRPEELAEQEARAVLIARTCRSYVAFASFAGPTGGDFDETAGCSSIWSPDGSPMARTGPGVGGVARAVLT